MEDVATKRSEKLPDSAAGILGSNPKRRIVKKGTSTLADNTQIVQKSEPVVSPTEILQGAFPSREMPGAKSQEDLDAEWNPIEKEKDAVRNFTSNDLYQEDEPGMKFEAVELPNIRKIAIKKINRFLNRLGLQNTPEKYNLMPGTSHTWMCEKRGNQFLTGLDDRPDVQKKLERALRVDLSNTSDFYASLTFMLEDKEHGQIMNFDDIQMGPYYEVVYYAMLVSPLVANGYQEYKSGKKPFAEWYIENKEAEAEALQENMTHEMEASALFSEISLSKRHSIAKLLKLNVWGVSEKVASVELWNYVKKDADNAKEFKKLAGMRPDELNVSVLVKNAIKLNVIRLDRKNDYCFANEVLGPTEEMIVRKLMVATNSPLRAAVARQVDAKM